MGSSQSNCVDVIGHEATYVQFENKVFREGTFRRVYCGTFHGDHRMEGKQCVVKVNKESYCFDLHEYTWRADDRAYNAAHKMAQAFNDHFETSKPIQFVKPEFARVDTHAAFNFLGLVEFPSNTEIPKNAIVAIERYLEGDFVKFTNNTAYVHPKKMATPAAFSHFTYDVSDGQILVCDLQGLRTDTSYKLTDPAVHNASLQLNQYGSSDLGKLGIVKFFESHECNALCEGFKKPETVFDCTTGKTVDLTKITSKIPGDKSSVHTYMLDKKCGISKSEREKIQKQIKIEVSEN